MFLSPLGPRINVAGSEGTVTSVGLTAPSIFSVSGSPVVGAGTLDFQLISQTQNKVLASPDGIAGIPSFRALVAGDLPSINFTNLVDVPASYTGQGGKVVAVNVAENALEFIVGGGGGSSTFIGLTDVPATFTGASLKSVRVNAGETALEFFTPSAGSGDVTGPASSVDNELTRFSGTTGKIIEQETTAANRVTLSGKIFSLNGSATLGLATSVAGVNRVDIGGGPTGQDPSINAAGTDANVGLVFTVQATTPQEVLRFNSSKAWNIAGAGFGTSGQFLKSNGSASAPTWATLTGGDVTGPASAVDNALAVYNGTTGKIIKNQATAITADSNGILGINNISKALRLVNNGSTNVNNFGMVGSAAGNPLEMSAEGTDSNIHMYITTKGTGGIAIRDGAAATPALMFGVDTNTGIFRAAADQLGISTGGTERAKFTTNLDLTCGQIKFPATQNASSDANTLDDYEEGTWTPSDASGAGLSFTVTSGTYVKIGKYVMARAHFTYPTTADASLAKWGGLPFTVSGFSSALVQTNTASLDLMIQVTSGTTLMDIYTAGATQQANSVFSDKYMIFNFNYLI